MNSALDLTAILAHPHTGGVQVLAEGADATWARTEFAASITELPAVAEPTLGILTAAAPELSWQQDALIRRAQHAGYAALAIPEADRIGAGGRSLARRLGVYLLHTSAPHQLVKACWQLEEGRDALTLGYVRHVAQSIEYHAKGLADLLRHLSASVGHGVALVAEDRVLLQAGGVLDESARRAMDFRPWLDTVSVPEGAVASVAVDSPSRPGLRLAIFDVGLNAVQLRALAVAAEVAMPAVAARILVDEVADVNDAAVASGLLHDFFEIRDGSTTADLDERMLERGWNAAGFHIGFRMIGRTRLDTLSLLRFVTRTLADRPGAFHAVISGQGITGWSTSAVPPTPDVVERAVAQFRALHSTCRRAFNVATGVGAMHPGAAGLRATIEGAADAARIAVAREATGWFVRIDTLGLEQLLLSRTEDDMFVPAATALLGPLLEDSPELLDTLAAFLDHESGIAATALAMQLHRNTVSTRIARVQEVLGLDLSDPEVRLAVHLACRAIRRSGTLSTGRGASQ